VGVTLIVDSPSPTLVSFSGQSGDHYGLEFHGGFLRLLLLPPSHDLAGLSQVDMACAATDPKF
jgi:hypothetical protein